MEKYILFLRGINVGGKNKISMTELKCALEEIGFTNVLTYINSGNVLFSSEISNQNVLIKKCEEMIIKKFEINISVFIITVEDLKTIHENKPEWWGVQSESVDYLIFSIPPMNVETIFSVMGAIKPEYEQIADYQNVIYWSTPLSVFSKTKYSKIASSSVNNHVTIRNANTIVKLLKLADKYEQKNK